MVQNPQRISLKTQSPEIYMNLKREMGKAVAAKKKKDKRNRNKPPKTNIPRMPKVFYSQDDSDIKARFSVEGTLEVDMPDTEEDDFWNSIYEQGDEE